MEFGVIKWFSDAKGFGMIKRSEGEDIFVHGRNVTYPGPGGCLREGQRVRFERGMTDKGVTALDVEVMLETREREVHSQRIERRP